MSYEITSICSIYIEKGKRMGEAIKRVLINNKIEIIYISPTVIKFVPWPVSKLEDNMAMKGEIFWNPINDFVKIKYRICVPNAENMESYSRCLRIYLIKWNEDHSKITRSTGLYFIYPEGKSGEIILRAVSRINIENLDKKIKNLLLLLNDTIEEESNNIIDILVGKIPSAFKNEMIEEIAIIQAEIYGSYEERSNGKNHSI